MRGTGGDGFLTKKIVRRFVQTPFGTAGVCREVTDQFTREFVHVGSFEVIDLLSLEIEDGRAKDDRYVDATAVEYFSVHDLPPVEGSRSKGCACWAAIARQIEIWDLRDPRKHRPGLFPLRLQPTARTARSEPGPRRKLAMNLLPLSRQSGHGQTCRWFDPVVNDPSETLSLPHCAVAQNPS